LIPSWFISNQIFIKAFIVSILLLLLLLFKKTNSISGLQ